MEEKDSAVKVFKVFLKRVQEVNLPLILLRPREISETISYTGDYDFFIPPEFNDSLLSVMFNISVATNSSFTITRTKHGKVDITLYSRSDNQSISLEIWNILSVKDPFKKKLRYILPEKLTSHIIEKEAGAFSLSLDVEALFYLSHLYTGGKKLTTPLVCERIDYYANALKDANSEYSILFYDLQEKKTDIKTVAHRANMELVSKKILPLKNDKNEMFTEMKLKAASTWNRTKRKLLSRIRLVPVMGPDGVGKTSLIEDTIKHSSKKIVFFRFKKTFRTSPLYRLFFPILKNKLRKEMGIKTHIKKTEVDYRYGNFVIFNAFLFYPFRLIRNIFSRQFVFVDRYFYEYLLKNIKIKSRKPTLRSDWKFWLAFTSRAYMVIHLDAPTETILQRKAELDEESIEAYREYLFKIYLKKPFMVYNYINTDLPLEQCRNLLLDICEKNIKCS